MVKLHVKKDDTVMVLTGKDRGKKGTIQRVVRESGRVVVDGVNVAKKHQKARPPRIQAGIQEKPMPIHSSNVMLICPQCKRPTRIGKKPVERDGRTVYVRSCKKCNEEI